MEEWSAGTNAALAGLVGGIVLGFCARWGRFCTLNAIESAVLGGDGSGLRSWAVAIAVACFGVYSLDHAALIDLTNSFYLANPTSLLATVFGGFIFGLGMALVGTCGYGCLARIGGGDLKSVVTFLVMGISAYATLRGGTSYFRVSLFPPPDNSADPASLIHYFAIQFAIGEHWIAYAVALSILWIAASSKPFRAQRAKLLSGGLVGLTVVWGWFATGVLAVDEFNPLPLQSYTFSAPMGDTLMYFMTMTGAELRFGVGAVPGVVIGAFVTAVVIGQFRWEACDDARELRRQIFGGFLMGVGGVTALGCTIGQGISAASVLAVSAPVALVSMFLGAWAGLHYLVSGDVLGMLKSYLKR